MAPRCRMPLSPSMEARLSNSQDSLISTGSNQELKTQLDSTLAEVEAIAEQLEKKQKKRPSLEKSPSDANSNNKPKPTVRRKASEQILASSTSASNGSNGAQNGGARPRDNQPHPLTRSSLGGASASDVSTSSSNEPAVMLRQGSWASREHISASPLTTATSRGYQDGERKAFSKNKTLWERRSSAQSTGGLATSTASDEGVRGGFRSNRDFWNQRAAMKQKQTPDLVLDLPAGTGPKPKPRPRAMTSGADSMSSSNSSSGDENLAAAADKFTKPDRDTLRKNSTKSNTPPEEKPEIAEKKVSVVHAKLRKNPPK